MSATETITLSIVKGAPSVRYLQIDNKQIATITNDNKVDVEDLIRKSTTIQEFDLEDKIRNLYLGLKKEIATEPELFMGKKPAAIAAVARYLDMTPKDLKQVLSKLVLLGDVGDTEQFLWKEEDSRLENFNPDSVINTAENSLISSQKAANVLASMPAGRASFAGASFGPSRPGINGLSASVAAASARRLPLVEIDSVIAGLKCVEMIYASSLLVTPTAGGRRSRSPKRRQHGGMTPAGAGAGGTSGRRGRGGRGGRGTSASVNSAAGVAAAAAAPPVENVYLPVTIVNAGGVNAAAAAGGAAGGAAAPAAGLTPEEASLLVPAAAAAPADDAGDALSSIATRLEGRAAAAAAGGALAAAAAPPAPELGILGRIQLVSTLLQQSSQSRTTTMPTVTDTAAVGHVAGDLAARVAAVTAAAGGPLPPPAPATGRENDIIAHAPPELQGIRAAAPGGAAGAAGPGGGGPRPSATLPGGRAPTSDDLKSALVGHLVDWMSANGTFIREGKDEIMRKLYDFVASNKVKRAVTASARGASIGLAGVAAGSAVAAPFVPGAVLDFYLLIFSYLTGAATTVIGTPINFLSKLIVNFLFYLPDSYKFKLFGRIASQVSTLGSTTGINMIVSSIFPGAAAIPGVATGMFVIDLAIGAYILFNLHRSMGRFSPFTLVGSLAREAGTSFLEAVQSSALRISTDVRLTYNYLRGLMTSIYTKSVAAAAIVGPRIGRVFNTSSAVVMYLISKGSAGCYAAAELFSFSGRLLTTPFSSGAGFPAQLAGSQARAADQTIHQVFGPLPAAPADTTLTEIRAASQTTTVNTSVGTVSTAAAALQAARDVMVIQQSTAAARGHDDYQPVTPEEAAAAAGTGLALPSAGAAAGAGGAAGGLGGGRRRRRSRTKTHKRKNHKRRVHRTKKHPKRR